MNVDHNTEKSMQKFRVDHARVITLIALGSLLGACGGHAGQDTSSVPGPAASSQTGDLSAGSQAGASSSNESADADAAQDEDQDDADARSNAQLDAMLNRKVPGGTLTYSFVETGHGSRSGMGIRHDSFSIDHRFSVTARMQGMVGGTTEEESHRSHVPSGLAGIEKAIDACGDDTACQQRAAMQAMSLSQQQVQDINRESRENSARSYRNVTWYTTKCHGTASVDDSDVGDGFDVATEGEPQPMSWNDKTRGSSQFDCSNSYPGPSSDTSSLVADGNSNHYDLSLHGGKVQATASHDGKSEPRPHEIEFRDFTAKGLKFDSLEKPFSGTRTLHPGKGRTLVVSWTFTPDKK